MAKTVASGGGLSSVASTYVENALPTSADDIFLDATSGDFTVDSTLACRSINCNGYTGIFTHNAGIAINIGDGTSAASNIALKFVNGMIYSRLNPATSAINFVSTNATQQQVEFGGNTFGNITFKGVGSSYIFNDDLTCQKYYATLDVQNGTVNTNDKIITCMVFTETTTATKTITLGASVINCYPAVSESFSWANGTGLTITANTAIVNVYRSPTNPTGATFIRVPTSKSNYLTLNVYGGGIRTIASGNSGSIFKDVNFYSAPPLFGIDDRVQMNVSFAVTGMVRIYGYSATRRTRVHNGGDFVIPNATALYCEYTDFQSVNIPTYTVDLSTSLGGAGDLGNNSGITFTAPKTCYWYQNIPGIKLWSDGANWFNGSGGTGGSSGKPLAQDACVFDSNSFTTDGCIVQCDLNSRQLGRDINWTGVTNNPTWDFQIDPTNFGSLTYSPNMSVTAYSDCFFTMFGSGSSQFFTVDFAGLQLPYTLFLINFAATNTCTLQSHFIGNASNTTLFQVTGLIDFNGKNITAGRFQQSSGTITMGTSIYTLKGVGTIWNCAGTVNAGTSEIIIDSQNATAKTFAGGGKVYNKLTLQGNYNDTITFSGNNTFGNVVNTKTSAFTLLYTAGSTTIFSGTYTKTAGALWTLGSTTTSIFTWSKASGSIVFVDSIISKSTASGGATFTANTDSIDGGGNTGWSGFVTDDFTWTNGDADNDYNNPLNWYGGNVPTSTDRAIFSAVSVANCTVPDGITFSVKGFLITAGYTGSITSLGDQNMSFGSDGIDINGGTLVATGNPVVDGTVKMANGVLNLSTAAFTVLSQGSTKPTISITGGTLTHNNNTIYIESGVGEAIVNTISTRPFGNLVFLDPLTYSGTSFVDLTFTIGSGITFNADVSVKGDIASTTTSGTGTIRLIGTTTQAVGASTIPNLQINASSTITLAGNVTVDSTLTITAVSTINGFSLICKGNIVSADTVIAGTTNTSIEGTNFEQAISGAGILIGDVTITKTNGLVKLNSNMNITDIGKNFTVTQGMFNTNEFNAVFGNNLTVAEVTGGLYVETANSSTQVNGTLTGRKLERQKLYAGITTI